MMSLRQSHSQMITRLALAGAIIGAAICLWISWCEYPLYAWNEVRLVPAFALRDGINTYPRLLQGPLFTWIYGPVGIIVNLPATLGRTPLEAIRIAYFINSLIVVGPLTLIFLGAPELRARGRVAIGLAFAVGILLIPWPNLILQVADHTAIGCGLLSLWFLAREPNPRNSQLALVAALTAMAVWSKQISVFLVVAHVSFLLLRGQRGAAWRYLIWLIAFNVVALGVFVFVFGASNLWLNLVEIPARLGWADFVPRLKQRIGPLIIQVMLPSVALLALVLLKRWPSRSTVSGRFFQLGILAYAAMLPIGLFAFFKVGGDTNLLHSWDYLMPAALLYWLTSDLAPLKSAALTIAVTGFALIARSDIRVIPPHAYTEHFEVAREVTARYPHAIWFPQNPLISYYADGRIWHSEDGVSTRFLAGYGINEAELKRHIPRPLRALAYPSVNTFPFSLPLFSDFSEKIRLPYWVLYTRPEPESELSKPAKVNSPQP